MGHAPDPPFPASRQPSALLCLLGGAVCQEPHVSVSRYSAQQQIIRQAGLLRLSYRFHTCARTTHTVRWKLQLREASGGVSPGVPCPLHHARCGPRLRVPQPWALGSGCPARCDRSCAHHENCRVSGAVIGVLGFCAWKL